MFIYSCNTYIYIKLTYAESPNTEVIFIRAWRDLYKHPTPLLHAFDDNRCLDICIYIYLYIYMYIYVFIYIYMYVKGGSV
jgi:hypothetical protein